MPLPPIRCSALVHVSCREAFSLFTERLGAWWPKAFTWSQDALEDLVIEPFAGGRCYEVGPQGFTCDFGRVLVCDPAERLAFTWQIDSTRVPQPDARRASEVEVRFTPETPVRTRVDLEHRAFERHGEGAGAYRTGMAQGWRILVEHLERARAGAAPSAPQRCALRVCIDVPDLEQGVAFYGAALGLRVVRRTPTAAELGGAPLPIDLLQKAPGTPATPGSSAARRAYGRHWTPVHLDIPVAHLEAAVERARAAGATLEAPPSAHAWGRLALLADPFGNGFCLLEMRGRGYGEP